MSNGPPIPPDPPPPTPFPPGVKTETRYAIVQENIVIGFSYNIIERLAPEAPPEQNVKLIESETAQIGWILDDNSGELVPPSALSQKTDPAERMMEEQQEQYRRTLEFYQKLASKRK